MNEFKQHFEIGDEAVNRKGIYTVTSFDENGMWIRYHVDGELTRLKDCRLALRISENMLIDMEQEQRKREWRRGYTVEEEDVDSLVADIEMLIAPQLRKLEQEGSDQFSNDILREAMKVKSGKNSVYAIALSELSRQDIWGYPRFKGDEHMPCIYVGQSFYSPEERFHQHKSHVRSSYITRRYGLALLPEIYGPYHSLSREMALKTELSLINALGFLGCTVFGN
jgi:hypothetical protein